MKRGNFSFVNTDALFSLFGFDFRLGFPIISAGNMNYLSQMVTFSAYLALGNHNLKEQIQDLIHGEGGQQPLPEAIKEIMDIKSWKHTLGTVVLHIRTLPSLQYLLISCVPQLTLYSALSA